LQPGGSESYCLRSAVSARTPRNPA
jgi:hypothetical protein